MKTYENESMFVNNFAKDAKSELKSNGKFEAEVNGVMLVITGMDNNNSSKVTIYKGSVNGVEFGGSITALKKRLNVTYTKEYHRSTEAARTANTKVVIKSDDELSVTAKTAAERIKNAVTVLKTAVQRYGLTRADMLEHADNVEAVILEALQRERDAAIERKRIADEKAAQLKEAKRIAEKAIADKRNRLMAELADASAKQDFASVMQLSKELAKLK